MLELKNGIGYNLTALAGDFNTGLFCRAKVFNAAGGSTLATVTLAHVANGMYIGSYTPGSTGLQHVVFEFFTDGGFTTPATAYSGAVDDIRVLNNDSDSLATTLATLATTAAVTALSTVATLARKLLTNRQKVDESLQQQIVYDDDKTTPLLTFNLKDKFGVGTSGNMAATDVHERNPV